MSVNTTNYGFVKPDPTDIPDITVLSRNWDVVDFALKLIDDRSKITTIDTANENINTYTEQGIYLFDSHTPTGVPSGCTKGWLLVIPWKDDYEAIQLWIGRDDSNVDTLYVRNRNYPNWTNWKQICTDVQLDSLKSELQTQIEMNKALVISNEQKIKQLRAAIGSPLQAATVSAMTDTTKIYVYTGSESGYTAGNWYFYNGTAWVSGGVYNSTAVETDKTLSISDVPADAKATGDEIADLKSAVTANAIEKTIDNLSWQEGSIRTTNGSDQTSSKRIRTGSGKYFLFNDINGISIGNGFKILIFVYSDKAYTSFEGMYNGTAVSSETTWLTENIYINQSLSEKYFRLCLGNVDDSKAEVVDGQNVTFWVNTDETFLKPNIPANAKMTGDAISSLRNIFNAEEQKIPFAIGRVQTDGTITIDENYLLSIPFYKSGDIVKITSATGYLFEILIYTKNNDEYTYDGIYNPIMPNSIDSSGYWFTKEQYVGVPEGKYFRIMGKKDPVSTMTLEDGDNYSIVNNVGITPKAVRESDYPLASNSVMDLLRPFYDEITYSDLTFTNDNSLIETYNNLSRGVGADSQYHAMTTYLKMNISFTVILPVGCKFKWYEYSDPTYTAYTKNYSNSWLDSGTTVPCRSFYYKIVVCKNDGTTVDLNALKNNVKITTYNYKYSFIYNLYNYGAWTHGSISTSDGTSNGTAEKYQNRCRTPILPIVDMELFSEDTTIVVTIYYYSSDSTDSYLGYIKHERLNELVSIEDDLVSYPTAKYIRFCVYRQDDQVIEDVESFIRKININIDSRFANVHEVPDTQGAANMVKRAYDLTNVRYLAANNMPAQELQRFPDGYIPTGTLCVGVKYSSTRNEQLYVPQAVSLKAYASAVLNPNSYIYTRISEVLPNFSPNSKTYYGAVCSTFVAYAYGIEDVIPTTIAFSTYPGFHRLPDYMQNPYSVKIGYMLNHRGSHISLITDIIRDSNGKIQYIQLSEAWHPYMEKNYRTPEWVKTERFDIGFEMYYYDYIDNVPAADNSAFLTIDSSLYESGVLNKNLAPRRGEDANWRPGETIEIDIINQESYTSYVLVNRETNNTITTNSISGTLISLSNLNAGKYKLFLSNGTLSSEAVNFNIVDSTETYSVSGNNVTVTYTSTIGTPSAVIFANNNTTPGSRDDYKAVRAFHVLTEEEIANGSCTIAKPEESETEYQDESYEAPNGVWKMRVMYKTDFGLYSSDFADVQF